MMTPLPAASSNRGERGERVRARTSACSRPPPATTSTPGAGTASDCANEVVDRDRAERLVLRRAAGAELRGYTCDRPLVRRLDDVDEVEVAERGPLSLDGRAALLDLPIA